MSDQQYHQKEIIKVEVYFEVSYKRGSENCRQDAISAAIRDVPFMLSGCGKHGSYGVNRKAATLVAKTD